MSAVREPLADTQSNVRTVARPSWRQRLVDAEGGFKLWLRTESTWSVHLFVGGAIVIAGLLFGLNLAQWALVIIAFTVVLAAELFNGVIRQLMKLFPSQLPKEVRQVHRMGTAAVLTAITGSLLVTLLVFGERGWELFGPR